jgi:hypothetical protein
VRSAGVDVAVRSLPDAPHVLHMIDPPRYVDVLAQWAASPPAPRRPNEIGTTP